ncbi:MAG: protein kinase domain-containing protein, partial [Bacteroidales bacterium]
ASDHERRARFEREAKTVAALSHANICALFDIGDHDGATFLVMEHLAGETLAARLHKGPLPLDQALTIATEIADALSAAHRHGVVHRDLKPGNIMLTKSGAKLLDFGLAKLRASGAVLASVTRSAEPATAGGAILGTIPYMAPEQLEGKDADARSDIFAFGAVLYEMLTGKRAFEGESHASVVAAILDRDPPPPSSVTLLTPPALDRFVRKCLHKDPERRWQTASDVADELRWLATGSGVGGTSGIAPGAIPASRRSAARLLTSRRATFVGFVLVLGIGAAAGIVLWRAVVPPPVSPGVAHLAIPVSTFDLTGVSDLAISPDGRTVVFAAKKAGDEARRLYVRELFANNITGPKLRPLPETEGAGFPFFSPDAQRVAFWPSVTGGLKWVSTSGEGKPQTVCDVCPGMGGVWMSDGRIVFAGGYVKPGLWEVPEHGGKPTEVSPQKPEGSIFYLHPDVLPDGKTILFTTFQGGRFALRSWTPKGVERVLIDGATRARYLPSGHLLYSAGDALRVQAIDPAKLPSSGRAAFRGTAETLADLPVEWLASDWAVSDAGILVYLPTYAGSTNLVWKDRTGVTETLPFKPRPYTSITVGPNGQRFVVGVGRRLYIGNVTGEPLQPLTDGPDDISPRFTRDGKSVAFARGDDVYKLYRVTMDNGSVQPLHDGFGNAPELNLNGTVVLFNCAMPKDDGYHICEKTLPTGSARSLIAGPWKSQVRARFSPDGRWIAYQASDNLTKWDVYVQQYPNGKRVQVSVDGGSAAAWNPKGTGELFYETGNSMMSATIVDGDVVKRQRLFVMPQGAAFDVHPDGTRFLMTGAVDSVSAPSQIYVLLNWLEELKGRKRK